MLPQYRYIVMLLWSHITVSLKSVLGILYALLLLHNAEMNLSVFLNTTSLCLELLSSSSIKV